MSAGLAQASVALGGGIVGGLGEQLLWAAGITFGVAVGPYRRRSGGAALAGGGPGLTPSPLSTCVERGCAAVTGLDSAAVSALDGGYETDGSGGGVQLDSGSVGDAAGRLGYIHHRRDAVLTRDDGAVRELTTDLDDQPTYQGEQR